MGVISLSRRSLSDEPLSITSIEIRSKDRRDSIWRCNFDLQGGEVIVFDSRKVHGNGVGSELSAELGAQLVLEHPAPGEPDDVLLRMRRLLDGTGYGDLDLDQPFDRWW